MQQSWIRRDPLRWVYPFDSAAIRVIEGGKTIRTINLPIAGVICDNLLHSITVDSLPEAYWISGLFNSEEFNELVMKQARGEPPGIYTIPVKIMEERNLIFDSASSTHLEISRLAKVLEGRMQKTIRHYLVSEKGLDIETVDDTAQDQEVPSTISSALMRRLNADEELDKLNSLVHKLLR